MEIDRSTLPIGANPERDMPWGTDESGFQQYRTTRGTIYTIRPRSTTTQYSSAPGSGSRVKDVIVGMLTGIVGGGKDALTAPGRALRGDPVTMGDALNLAGMVQLGAAAMPAPKGAMRSGAMRVADDAAESPAQSVARMLRDGRAGDITDDIMAQVDPAEMRLLYESGATGVPMPMDDASRMARAKESGFNTDTTMYHGTAKRFENFDQSMQRDPGVWLTNDMANAANYADSSGDLIEAFTRKTKPERVEFDYDDYGELAAVYRGEIAKDVDNVDLVKMAHSDGADSVVFPGGNFTESGYTEVILDPRNIRRTSARFDPRLRHLANLSAGVGSVTLMSDLLNQPQDAREAALRDYLK